MAEIGLARGMRNTDTEIRNGVWLDATKGNGADLGLTRTAAEAVDTLTKAAGPGDLAAVKTRVDTLPLAADVNAQVDIALDTAVPVAPTADSVNERVKTVDELIAAGGAGDLAAVKTQVDKGLGLVTTGIHTHTAVGGTTKQFVTTVAITARRKLLGIWLDLVNLTQNAVIEIEWKMDGTNFRIFASEDWTTAMDDLMFFARSMVIDADLKVSLTSTTAEAVDVTVPFKLFFELM